MRRTAALLLALALGAACERPPTTVHYDLAHDAALAEHLLPGEIRVALSPPAVVRAGLKFLREQGQDDVVAATRYERTAFVTWRRLAPRDAVLDLEAPRAQGEAVVFLNEKLLQRVRLSEGRGRYRVPLPESAQSRRRNRLRVEHPEQAQLHDAVVGAASDPALALLLQPDAPPPLAAEGARWVPSLLQAGPSTLRFALRLPEAAELRFRPAPAKPAVGARLRVSVETADGERDLWTGVAPRDEAGAEVAVRLPGPAGTLARLSLHVEASGFAAWAAPRVLGRGAAYGLAAPDRPAAEERRADPLRRTLTGSNVLLVILDAASARHFHCYGYQRATTPEIDRLAAEGVLFEQAYTPAVYTLSAMASLWTSLHHDQHHEGVRHSEALPPAPLTIPERLQAGGVYTAGFVANPSAGRPFGLARGFAEFHELYRAGRRFVGVPRALDFRPHLARFFRERSGQGRFLAYIHFIEPHFPYDPLPPFRTLFGPDGPLPDSARRSQDWIRAVNDGGVKPTREERDHLVRLYDGNLAAVDHEVGLLRSALEAAGLWDKTLVIVSADHAEALGEHGFIGHAPQLYEEAIHIPLILRFPKGTGPPGLRVRGFVDLLDLGPTLLDVFGLAGREKPARLEGRSLLPVVAGAPAKPAVVARTMAERPAYAVLEGRYKLVHSLRDGLSELYDLEADPLETRDLADSEALRVEVYRQALYRWLRDLRRGAGAASGGATTLSEEEREALRALGYVQ